MDVPEVPAPAVVNDEIGSCVNLRSIDWNERKALARSGRHDFGSDFRDSSTSWTFRTPIEIFRSWSCWREDKSTSIERKPAPDYAHNQKGCKYEQ